MEVALNITRSDLLKMSYYTLFRIQANYIWFAMIFICAGAGARDLVTQSGILIWLLFSALLSVVMYFLLFNIGVLVSLVFASAEKGFIGPTVYHLSDEFFIETTNGTETKTKWVSVHSIYKFKNYMFVRINGYRVHVIPKREFNNSQAFEQFCSIVNDRVKSA